MATILTRTAKGSELTIAELDANLVNINNQGINNTQLINDITDDLTIISGTVSTNTQAISDLSDTLDNKVDKVTGLQLSQESYTTTEKNKLQGVSSGATVNDTDVNLKNRANHTGTQSADTIVDGSTNKVFSTADKTKLDTISSGATANSTDAQLRDRSTHTGTQAISTITSLQSALDGKANIDGSNASGSWNINISGNATTVTDGIYTTGSYANPTWLTSLSYGKIVGTPNLTNYVDRINNQTVNGVKTFTSTIIGSIDGNSATVTNGVYTSSSYANPSWLTSFEASKITEDATHRFFTDSERTKLSGIASGAISSVTINGQTGINFSLDTDNIPESSTKKYSTGTLVLGYLLNGFVAGAGSIAIAATDSILGAFQKIAGSISDVYTQLSTKLNQTEVDSRVNLGLEASTIYFDNVTLKLQNPALPMSNENPLVATAIPNVTNSITNGDMNAVTSNAVYLALQPVLQDIMDIYEAISSGLAPATAPTAFVVDDVADTADWTNTVGFTDVSDYEYQINGGTITTATEKPINIGNINAAIGDVKIRVKGVPGETSPSAWLTNPTAYFAVEEGNYLTGFTPIVLDDNIQDTGKPLSNEDGSWFTTYDSSFFISSTVLEEGDRIAVLLTATDNFIFGVTTSELFNPKGLSYNLADGLRLKESGDVTAFAVQPVTGDFLIFEAHAAGPKVYKVTSGVETELVVPSNFIESLQNVSGAIFGANNTLSYPSIKRA